MQINKSADKLETLSANFDGVALDKLASKLSAQDQQHLENWSAIGAVLRDELPTKTDFDFASKVMSAIEKDEKAVVQDDQAFVPQKTSGLRFVSFKKLGIILTETVVAASVCMITIFGYQTWNAQDNVSLGNAVGTMGTVSGVNLASYQNRAGGNAISLDQNVQPSSSRQLTAQEQRELAQKREQEAERISNYLKGYVLNTASN